MSFSRFPAALPETLFDLTSPTKFISVFAACITIEGPNGLPVYSVNGDVDNSDDILSTIINDIYAILTLEPT